MSHFQHLGFFAAKNILEFYVMQYVWNLKLGRQQWSQIQQQIYNVMKNKRIKVLQWPSQIPGLKLIYLNPARGLKQSCA